MDDFLKELLLALEDYFCGTFTERDGAIIARLNDGYKFEISVKTA